jgi:hypothetical protein
VKPSQMNRMIRTALLTAASACALSAQAPPTPKAAAPIDLTGYWVSIITEDWRYRMLTAPKGDYYSIPLNQEAIKVANAYTPTQADACRNYGAPTIMRTPGRVHITWDSDTTLKVEADAGKQTRTFTFAGGAGSPTYSAATGMASAPKPVTGEPTMQGVSIAQWQTPQITRAYWQKVPAQNPNTPGFPGINMSGPPPPPDTRKLGGSLKVVTSHLKPGLLRNNGVPYSANTLLTEYYDVHKEKNGDQWLVVTSIVEDAQYLDAPWITTSHFKREPDGSKWDPQPCELLLPNVK